jgi:hypothetical protein
MDARTGARGGHVHQISTTARSDESCMGRPHTWPHGTERQGTSIRILSMGQCCQCRLPFDDCDDKYSSPGTSAPPPPPPSHTHTRRAPPHTSWTQHACHHTRPQTRRLYSCMYRSSNTAACSGTVMPLNPGEPGEPAPDPGDAAAAPDRPLAVVPLGVDRPDGDGDGTVGSVRGGVGCPACNVGRNGCRWWVWV